MLLILFQRWAAAYLGWLGSWPHQPSEPKYPPAVLTKTQLGVQAVPITPAVTLVMSNKESVFAVFIISQKQTKKKKTMKTGAKWMGFLVETATDSAALHLKFLNRMH